MFFGPVFFGGQTSGKSYGLASDSSKGEWRPGDNVVQLRFDRSGSAELDLFPGSYHGMVHF